MIYSFIEEHKEVWPVTFMCRTLKVSPQGYFGWCSRPKSQQEQRREAILVEIRSIHAEVKHRYGSPRIHAELQARNINCCVNTVAKLMHNNDVRAKTARKFRNTTDSNHDKPVMENQLDREFEAQSPNEKWPADISYVPTREGWLNLAVVEDLYSRMVVGWSMAERMTSRLVVDALEMAIQRRFPGEGLMTHSDRVSQYAGEHYQERLNKHGIICSMSGVGQCWDNAPMERFLVSQKKELVHQEDYQSRAEAKRSIFEYIETFYNGRSRHSTLNYLSPREYEQQTAETVKAKQKKTQTARDQAFFHPQHPSSRSGGVGGERMPKVPLASPSPMEPGMRSESETKRESKNLNNR